MKKISLFFIPMFFIPSQHYIYIGASNKNKMIPDESLTTPKNTPFLNNTLKIPRKNIQISFNYIKTEFSEYLTVKHIKSSCILTLYGPNFFSSFFGT